MQHFFWTLGATMTALVHVTGSHPLCRALEGGKPPSELDGLPTRHTCHGGSNNDMVACSSAAEASGRSSLASSSTWWICHGQRDPEDISGEEVVDCEGYFAVRGDTGDSGRKCQSPGMRRALQEENPPSDIQPKISMDPDGPIELSTKPVDLGRTWVCGEAEDEMVPIAEQFVHTANNDCDPMWKTWPDAHEAAVAKGTVIVFSLFPSVGNVFIALSCLIKVALMLELAVVLDVQKFQGFRVAFDPARIMWDLDVAQTLERADDIAAGTASDLHALKLSDGCMILTDSQLERMAQLMGIVEASSAEAAVALEAVSLREILKKANAGLRDEFGRGLPAPPPCAWNMLLRRSSSMLASLAAQCPWGEVNDRSGLSARPSTYVAWHIRTSDGETKNSFNPDVHQYIFHNQSSTAACPLFLSTTVATEEACKEIPPEDVDSLPVYISSNSKSMTRHCSVHAKEHMVRAGFVDLGVADSDAHTGFSSDPALTATNAFIDYLMLVDASIMVVSGSSFSGTAAMIKGLTCRQISTESTPPVPGISICLPAGC